MLIKMRCLRVHFKGEYIKERCFNDGDDCLYTYIAKAVVVKKQLEMRSIVA